MAASRCWSRLESFGSPFEDAERRPQRRGPSEQRFIEQRPRMAVAGFGAFNAPARRPRSMGLRDLSDEMFEHYKRSNQMHHLQQAFSSLPVPEMLPADAYRRLVRTQVERVPLDDAANRVVATRVVPYPPGVPMMMPGENTGPDRWALYRQSEGATRLGSALRWLWTRNPWGRGQAGEQYLHCLKQQA
jgi:hypothetical protein